MGMIQALPSCCSVAGGSFQLGCLSLGTSPMHMMIILTGSLRCTPLLGAGRVEGRGRQNHNDNLSRMWQGGAPAWFGCLSLGTSPMRMMAIVTGAFRCKPLLVAGKGGGVRGMGGRFTMTS